MHGVFDVGVGDDVGSCLDYGAGVGLGCAFD